MSRLLWAVGVTLTLAIGATGSAVAQGAPGEYGPGPASDQDSGGMRHWGGGHRMLSRGVLEGPPAPAVLHDSIGLSGDQLTRYSQQYSNYIAETGPTRDSLRVSLRQMHDARQAGDRTQIQSRRDSLRKQAQSLAQRDQEFEKVLRQDLTKEQQKRYDQWKDARAKAARQRHQASRS
jgi:hypothetical protein